MTVNVRVEYDGQSRVDTFPIFRPGQQVRARVVLSVLKPIKARDVKLHISGKAKVHWTETRTHTTHRPSHHTRFGSTHFGNSHHTRFGSSHCTNNRTHTEIVHFRSDVTYLDQWILLWSSPDQILPPGDLVFSFAFTIPAHCPPTYIGTYGKIVYKCKVDIDHPWKFDKKFTSNFIVAPVYDLNATNWVQNPQVHQISKSIGSCCCKRGILLVEVCLPKGGFVPGERIPIILNIKNKTSREVTKVRATLVEKSIFMASEHRWKWKGFVANDKHHRSRESSMELDKLDEFVEMAPRSDAKFEAVLLVPPCMPSFDNYHNVKVVHLLEVKINVHRCCCDSVAASSLPVVIGTIGLNSNMKPELE